MTNLDFSIAVFGVNEASTLADCLGSIDRASKGYRVHISVLLNGTQDNSVDVLRGLRLAHSSMTVYMFPVADKSNAINYFIHELRLDARRYAAVDAYTTIEEHALRVMDLALVESPRALLASGIPLSGRSATLEQAKTLNGGTLNGQFYCITSKYADTFKEQGLRLPLQMYRGDGLLGSIACHGFDSLRNPWSDYRIVGVKGAGFMFRPLSPWLLRDIKRQFKREVRQAQGQLEGESIKKIIYKDGFKDLPANALTMIRDYIQLQYPVTSTLRRALFMKLALRYIDTAALIKPELPQIIFSD